MDIDLLEMDVKKPAYKNGMCAGNSRVEKKQKEFLTEP